MLSLGSDSAEKFPRALQDYLALGDQMGLPERALIRTRQPWYRMETRDVPPLLFAYLGRRSTRFILNEAGALPLTGFLCVYPEGAASRNPRRLWQALNHPATLAHLQFVGKSYGDGAIKVEPRALEQLTIPREVIEEFDLRPNSVQRQQLLLDQSPVPHGGQQKTVGGSALRRQKR
ncbi:MAG: hypothetical protein HC841_03850 [Verrucomicrobiae bacterium]|nr:hypothetical protein [Verrucomicrobiae bacterium]